jgi:hypothetical protein
MMDRGGTGSMDGRGDEVPTSDIQWRRSAVAECVVLQPQGALDARTYRTFRDDLLKFAMDQPRAVIVVVDDLRIESAGSLTAFTSVWMRVGDWPGVPILLVAKDVTRRCALGAITRFVPVHRDLDGALASLREPPARRRTEIELFCVTASSRLARVFVRSTCRRWNLSERIEGAMEVATELVENAIIHAGTDLGLRLELRNGRLTIAVRDGSPREAVLRERSDAAARGLHLVAHFARPWGCAPDTHGGKVVWAVLDA